MTDRLLLTLAESFPFAERNVGEFASLKANGMTFSIRAYDAKGLGHVSVMHANGFFGFMQMDTLIINPLELDLPLYSYDRIHAMGNDTLIVELYDTLLGPTDLDRVDAVKQAFSDLTDYPLGEHWYDGIKLPESVSKKGKKAETPRFDALAQKHLSALIASAPDRPCDPDEKRKKASVYVEGLLTRGGPSTDGFLKALGKEKTERLFRTVLFGTDA